MSAAALSGEAVTEKVRTVTELELVRSTTPRCWTGYQERTRRLGHGRAAPRNMGDPGFGLRMARAATKPRLA
jgi:hypothetical protein